MKLHRMVLTNYRGITHREIEFPDRGVVVVSGANEIGKSSMIEALDLLLESKDRSSKKEVKQVKPTHADVGAEITAEISTGPYRFVFRKRFHKRCETELTVLAPRREQLTGDEAHDRVRAMLDETVDTCLWQAQRVLQSASTAAVDLSGAMRCRVRSTSPPVRPSHCPAPQQHRRAADRPRSRPSTSATSPEPAVPPAVGRGDESAAGRRRGAGPLRGGDRGGRRRGAAARGAHRRAGPAGRRAHGRDEAARDGPGRRRRRRRAAGQLKEAEQVAAAAEAVRTTSVAAVNDRRRLRERIDERAAAIVELEAVGRRGGRGADHRRRGAAGGRRRGRAGARATWPPPRRAPRPPAEVWTSWPPATKPTGWRRVLAKIAGAQRDLDAHRYRTCGHRADGDGMRAIETASAAVDVAMGQVELVSAHVELVASLTSRCAWTANRRASRRARHGRRVSARRPTSKSRVY